MADGATRFTDLDVLARQPAVFGPVVSVATAWRTLADLDADALDAVAQARRRAWAAGLDPGFYVGDARDRPLRERRSGPDV